jgi:hypothetical protein
VGTITMQVSQDGVIDAKSVRAIVQEE